MPVADDPFVVFALGHASVIDHLILAKHVVHWDLLQKFLVPVQFLHHDASIHLSLHHMGLPLL